MKKEYCKIQEIELKYEDYCKTLVNVSYNSMDGLGRISTAHNDITIRLPSVWKVLIGTADNPYTIVDRIQQYCATNNDFNNEIRLENSDERYHWETYGEKNKILLKIEEYARSLGYKYEGGIIKPIKKNKYMTNDTGMELVFFSELDAFNYLSENGGWYLDHIVPVRFDGEFGGPIGSTYIMARDIDE